VIVGAGPTGVELAGAISELSRMALASDFRHIDPASAKVILIEAGSRILASFSEKLSQRAAQELTGFGVEMRTHTRVEKMDRDGVYIAGQKIKARTVIWAAGVVASPAGQWLGCETDRAGRIIVQPDLSVPARKNIYAIGDTISFIQNGESLPGVSPVAMQQGRYVARLLKAKLKGKSLDKPFHYLDKGNLATIGRSFAIAQIGGLRFSGLFAWIVWLVVHIYYLIGFRNRLVVIIQWAYAYMTFKPGARLIVNTDKASSYSLD
jgi:NADH dehydrogenase